jgi:eukaryotic-like serine/threonine-protein kinase
MNDSYSASSRNHSLSTLSQAQTPHTAMNTTINKCDQPPPLSEGEPLAPDYTVTKHLRRGDALDVYEVWSESRACLCVAKTICPHRAEDIRPRERLLQEGLLLEQATHPHLVRAYQTITEPVPIIILELLVGATLGHLISQAKSQKATLDCEELSFLGQHLCSALQYVHAKGIVHLDIKPSNIIAYNGMAKIIDFSVATKIDECCRKGVGTKHYLAPEQAQGELVTQETDVWGIGTTLFEAAAGKRAFTSKKSGPKYPQLTKPAPPIASIQDMPSEFARIIDSCLAFERGDRPNIEELYCAFGGKHAA